MTILKSINCINKYLLLAKINKYLKQFSKNERRKHSWQVAKLAKKLCLQYNEDPWKGMIAGLSHDIAREFNPEKIKYYAGKEGIPFSELEQQNPLLLHGRAAAVILKESFGITDALILRAVRDHVTGGPEMPTLSKIIFIADILEPKRDFLDDYYRRKLLKLPLDTILFHVLEIVFFFLRKQGQAIAGESQELYNQLMGNMKNGEKI